MSNQTTAIMLDRLENALATKGIVLKRQALLEIASHAFGFRDGNAFSAAAKTGRLDPEKATVLRTITIGDCQHSILADSAGRCATIVPSQMPKGRSYHHALSYEGVMLQLPENLTASSHDDATMAALQEIKSSLDNFTATPGDEDAVGQAELAIKRAIDCHTLAASAAGVASECAFAEDILQTVDQASDGYENVSNAIHLLGDLRGGAISRHTESARDRALQKALNAIDDEIENRKSSGDPSYWADLQSIWDEGHNALKSHTYPKTCVRCDTQLIDDRCQDETCPFSECSQSDSRGWIGHPDHKDEYLAKPKSVTQASASKLKPTKNLTWITNVEGENTFEVSRQMLDDLSLSYQVEDGHYFPLTDKEVDLLHTHEILNIQHAHPVRMGSSAIWNEQKCLALSVEFNFNDKSSEITSMKDAQAYAGYLKPLLEKIGGHIFIDESVSDCCHEVIALVPMDVAATASNSEDLLSALSYLMLPQEAKNAQKQITCDFLAQAWLKEHPIAVDPQGDTSWDATFDVLLSRGEIRRAIENDDLPEDILAQGYCAPEWIRNWTNAFEVYYDDNVMDAIINDKIVR